MNTVMLLIVIAGFIFFDQIVRYNPDKKKKPKRPQ